MDKQFKEVLVMNLMYNLLLAIVLSIVAQILSFGTVMWPAVLVDMLSSLVVIPGARTVFTKKTGGYYVVSS